MMGIKMMMLLIGILWKTTHAFPTSLGYHNKEWNPIRSGYPSSCLLVKPDVLIVGSSKGSILVQRLSKNRPWVYPLTNREITSLHFSKGNLLVTTPLGFHHPQTVELFSLRRIVAGLLEQPDDDMATPRSLQTWTWTNQTMYQTLLFGNTYVRIASNHWVYVSTSDSADTPLRLPLLDDEIILCGTSLAQYLFLITNSWNLVVLEFDSDEANITNVRVTPVPSQRSLSDMPISVAVCPISSPVECHIAIGTQKGVLHVFDLSLLHSNETSGTPLRFRVCHLLSHRPVRYLYFSTFDQILVVTHSRYLRLIQWITGKVLLTIPIEEEDVLQVQCLDPYILVNLRNRLSLLQAFRQSGTRKKE